MASKTKYYEELMDHPVDPKFWPDGVKLADIIAMLSRWRSDYNITQNAFHSIIMLIQNVLLREHKDQPTSQYDNNFPPTAYIADRLI